MGLETGFVHFINKKPMEKASSQVMPPTNGPLPSPKSKLLSMGTRRIKLIKGAFWRHKGSRELYGFMN